MKTFEIRVTQDLSGFYEGTITMKALSEKAALNKLKKMSNQEINEDVDWTHGDEYWGDYTTIEIDKDSINEI